MVTMLKSGRFAKTACLALLFAILCAMGVAVRGQSNVTANAITITLTGQSMMRSDLRATAPPAVPVIQGLLKGDVVFTNFEAAVAEKGETVHEGRGFLTPPEALDALTTVGFNLLSLSGNHAFDLKATGIQNTIREADSRKIVHAGTGNSLAEGAARGFLNTPNQGDSQRLLQSIRDARQHADLVIVYQHNHVFGNHSFATIFTEGMPERLAPNDWLKKWTHAEVDAGADIIVMHGAPLLHGVEIYHGKPIFYDLGNFIYNLPPTLTYIDEPMNWESAVAYVQFQGKNLRSISFRPIALNNVGEGQPDIHNEYANNQFLDTRGLPSPVTGARAGYILQRLADASKPFGTTMEIKGDTAEIKLKAGN